MSSTKQLRKTVALAAAVPVTVATGGGGGETPVRKQSRRKQMPTQVPGQCHSLQTNL